MIEQEPLPDQRRSSRVHEFLKAFPNLINSNAVPVKFSPGRVTFRRSKSNVSMSRISPGRDIGREGNIRNSRKVGGSMIDSSASNSGARKPYLSKYIGGDSSIIIKSHILETFEGIELKNKQEPSSKLVKSSSITNIAAFNEFMKSNS